MEKTFPRGILFLGAVLHIVFGAQVTFNGSQYIGFDLNSIPLGNRRNLLQLRFRTIHGNGVLANSEGTSKDYFRLELTEGTLSLECYLGGKHVTRIKIGNDLADSKWHKVRIKQTGRLTNITLDSYTVTELARQRRFHVLNLDTLIYVGGMGNDVSKNGFRGCLADVNFDDTNLLVGAFTRDKRFVVHGAIANQCSFEEYSPLTFSSRNSYVKFLKIRKRSMNTDTFSTSFKFRTFIKEGAILSTTAVKVNFQLKLVSGSLLFEITADNGSKNMSVQVGRNLNDGEWHTVEAIVHQITVTLTVDGVSETMRIIDQSITKRKKLVNKLRLHVVVGKALGKSFVGCLLNLKIDNHMIGHQEIQRLDDLGRSVMVKVGKCEARNRCYPNPCKNGGKCNQDYKTYHCNCSDTEFEGETCEDTIYKQTCEEYRQIGLSEDSYCLVRFKDEQQGKKPQVSSNLFPKQFYTVLCNATDTDKTYTVIGHTKMGNNSVGRAVPQSDRLSHDIQYLIPDMKWIKALVKSSQYCRQFIRYDCLSSLLFSGPKNERVEWFSPDGRTPQTYWGGAEPDSRQCACAKDNNCAGPLHCNCDVRDNVWRFDEGYFIEKDRLPVKRLEFHTHGANSYFTLGPLECWGTAQKTISTSRDEVVSLACLPVHLPTPSPTTQQPHTTGKTTRIDPCDIADSASGHCGRSTEPEPTTAIPTTQRFLNSSFVTTVKRSVEVIGQKGNPPSLEEFQLSVTAIVLISCVIVVVLLLFIRCELPRIVVCVRGLSRRGEANFTTVSPRTQITAL